jgi:DNA-directed RNA polymerase subunit alpha
LSFSRGHPRISVRALKCLLRLKMETIGDLYATRSSQILDCRNTGLATLAEIRGMLADVGLKLRED